LKAISDIRDQNNFVIRLYRYDYVQTALNVRYTDMNCYNRLPSVLIGWLGVRVPAGAVNFPIHHVQNGSGTQPASYPVGTRGSFPGVGGCGLSW